MTVPIHRFALPVEIAIFTGAQVPFDDIGDPTRVWFKFHLGVNGAIQRTNFRVHPAWVDR